MEVCNMRASFKGVLVNVHSVLLRESGSALLLLLPL